MTKKDRHWDIGKEAKKLDKLPISVRMKVRKIRKALPSLRLRIMLDTKMEKYKR